MAKNEISNNENEYTWDSGTYQTGATKEQKTQSGIITGLLIAVIFLGGLASALGLMNIRLMEKLLASQEQLLPLSVEATDGPSLAMFQWDENPAPRLPGQLQLQLSTQGHTVALTPEQILQANQPAMVLIYGETSRGQLQQGVGVVLSSDGMVLTNADVVENTHRILVEFSDGTRLRATLVASDAYADVAVLYVQGEHLPTVTLDHVTGHVAPDGKLYVAAANEEMISGMRLQQFVTMKPGRLSVVLEKTEFAGMSGPVFDEYGRVHGFLCRPLGRSEEGLMLNSAQLATIATQLVEQGTVSGRPSLGLRVQEVSNFSRQYWNVESGLEITHVDLTHSNEMPQLLKGDILLTLQGQPLDRVQQLYLALLEVQPGQSLELEVFRAGQYFTITLPVQQVP